MKNILAGMLTLLLITPLWAHQSSFVNVGGYGGNSRIGRLIYNGEANGLAALKLTRTDDGKCLFANENAIIGNGEQTSSFMCDATDPTHHNLYWNGEFDATNGAYSPENDVMFTADTVVNMFQDWYHIAPYTDADNVKKPFIFKLHESMAGTWLRNDGTIVLGDGDGDYYPFTTFTLTGYNIGLLFARQNGMDTDEWFAPQAVAFSCMTAMAAEYYLTGKNTWQVAEDSVRTNDPDSLVQYMDMPSKNCHGRDPGDHCSIDTHAQDKYGVLGYHASGLFNRAFYLLATTKGWNTRKAYDVFVQAVRYHWRYRPGYLDAACSAVRSANELGYNLMDVRIAFSGVGIDTRDCSLT